MKWFNKFNLQSRKGSLNCPLCEFKYDEEIFYSLDSRKCLNCKTELFIFRVSPLIVTINLTHSPNIIKTIQRELSHLTQKKVINNLKSFFFFSHKKTNHSEIVIVLWSVISLNLKL